VVSRQNADIANTVHPKDIVLLTTFGFQWTITSVVS